MTHVRAEDSASNQATVTARSGSVVYGKAGQFGAKFNSDTVANREKGALKFLYTCHSLNKPLPWVMTRTLESLSLPVRGSIPFSWIENYSETWFSSSAAFKSIFRPYLNLESKMIGPVFLKS